MENIGASSSEPNKAPRLKLDRVVIQDVYEALPAEDLVDEWMGPTDTMSTNNCPGCCC
jgi:uncharacterized protein YndB with AHSA1/START domain